MIGKRNSSETCSEFSDKLVDDLSEVARMLESMMQKSSSFCGQDSLMVREDRADY